MNIQERYESAKEIYAGLGVDVDAAVERLKNIPVSMHCWQGDDVMGFEGADSLSGGIQATGNYPGKARNPRELMADIDKALSLIPGKHRINLHASYAIFTDGEKRTATHWSQSILQSGWSLPGREDWDWILTQPCSPIQRLRMPPCPVRTLKSENSGLTTARLVCAFPSTLPRSWEVPAP